MAVHAHSTPAPARALLPRTDFSPAAIVARAEAFASTIATRVKARPPVEDHRSPEELLEEILRTIEGEAGVVSRNDTPEPPTEPLLPNDAPHGGAPVLKSEACGSRGLCAAQALLPLPAPLPSLPAALSRRRAIFGAVALAATPVAAQAAQLGVLKSEETPATALRSGEVA